MHFAYIFFEHFWVIFSFSFLLSFIILWCHFRVYRAGSSVVGRRAAAIKAHWRCLWQVIKWSLVSPAACMKEWTTVGPTNLKPLLTMSLLMLSDFDVFTGILCPILYWVEIGLWLTNPHIYLSNDPNSLWICNTRICKTTTNI